MADTLPELDKAFHHLLDREPEITSFSFYDISDERLASIEKHCEAVIERGKETDVQVDVRLLKAILGLARQSYRLSD